MVTKHHNDAEYREALEGWSKHDIERVHIYHCLNYVLLHLDEGWRGLHLLVLVFLLRAGIRRLQTYLARARRPAALLLLVSGLNDPEFIAQRRDRMLHLLSEAMPIDALVLQQLTPLGILQDRVKHIVRPSIVTVALCYDDGYWTRAVPQSSQKAQQRDPQHFVTPALFTALPTPARTIPNGCAEVDVRQNLKRGMASTPGGDEAGSPTKRRRLNVSNAESSDGIDEVAKVTELAGIAFPAMAESDGTPLADTTSHGLKRKRSISEYRISQERTLTKPRLTAENRDDQAAAVDSAELSSATKTSVTSGKDASEHRQRTSGADRLPVADPSEANHHVGASKLLSQIRSSAQTLADELENQSQEIWTGAHPLIMLSAGFCKPRDLRLLASDGRLTDEILNTIPVLGDCKDTDGYLLPTFVAQLIREGRFKDLDRWTMGVPKQSKPWVFGLHESDHWMAVRIDWTGRLIHHYDPMHQKLTGRSRRILKLPPATSPSMSYQGEQRDECTSLKPPRNAKDLQVDTRPSDRTALDARCGVDATSVERLAHAADDQTQHTVEPSADLADHTRSYQPEYASDYREDSERMPREDPGLQSAQAAFGGLSVPASQDLLGTGGAQPSPGIAFCSHFEDALGEGFDSWYEPIEAAVQGVETLPALASMSEWDAWLQQ
ncbi:hypothetical protein B0A55_07959 [Friedmanniomyces simplex]|uniref:Uncharacterized protein n=1 Tax=Friedmanniomyces simplex TaxID=329884 RepID=A0A4U0XCY4_9PEZI|nr:hypothetical protein B0A55_07959 [Friedmanniomyces simplex]